ncbi:hypothetical protein LEP3755_24730 [Leptolyngbya sp. NIES-3755]|nr:hypothetical protein LEP3755_24730 [Leptolyngbya sp. NIES-3755]
MAFRYLVPCIILLTSCSQTRWFDRAEQMQQYFTQRITVGMPVERARQVLGSEGFNVITNINKPFNEEEGNKYNYLSGERIDGFIFVRVWHVYVFFENNAVVKVVSEMREVGP